MSDSTPVITQFAPGKLMLAGEWAVLEPGNPCIVLAVNEGVTAKIVTSNKIIIDSPDVGLRNISLTSSLSPAEKQSFIFVRFAIKITLNYLRERCVVTRTFRLSIRSSLTYSGLGSSAASVVAVTKAILEFHDFDVFSKKAKQIIFKLSSLAHFQAQGFSGSCFDVAASTYAGTLVYKRFDPEWLSGELARCESVSKILGHTWPGLEIKPIELPEEMRVVSRFAGREASTRELVAKMGDFKKKNFPGYQAICNEIALVVNKLVHAIEVCDKQVCAKRAYDKEKILSLVRENRVLLKKLAEQSKINLETPEMKKLCDSAERCGGAAKFSGAGGGDCVISICFSP
ncbi:phosphomevalonate kinase [Candidatus Babeliales bacterium]|nr:phosphomevalonate kinase [Candidatus Babeliales bacterium]